MFQGNVNRLLFYQVRNEKPKICQQLNKLWKKPTNCWDTPFYIFIIVVLFFTQSVRIWDIIAVGLDPTDATPLHVIHNCHDDWVTDCKWSEISDVIVTSSNDFNLKVWDVSKIGDTPGETHKASTGTNICKEKYVLRGHMSAVNHIGYSVSISIGSMPCCPQNIFGSCNL